MGFAILGLGTAVPPTVVNQTEALEIARALCCRTGEQATWLPGMYGHTGIDTRHVILGPDLVGDALHGTQNARTVIVKRRTADDAGPTTGERMRIYADEAVPLALRAARQALDRSGLAPHQLTHLITVSCTGFFAPGVDVELIRGLPLAPTVQRTHVGFMGCHGALNGLRVARALTTADPDARVLLCALELCSLHYQYGWDPQRVIANALFADGAAAVIGGPSGAAPGNAWRAAAEGSYLFANTADAMTWTVGDHGFVMTLSKRVPALIAAGLRPWLEGWLAQHGVALADVGSWAVHPGGPRILDAVENALGLAPGATAASRAVFAQYGNMSSPTVLFILDHLQRLGAPRPCVALGFGPGLMAEAVLFR
jgi:predicted naringenin-chalcone synthase